jgi:hypothetical protein
MSFSDGGFGGSGGVEDGNSGFCPIILTSKMKPKKVARALARIVNRGIQICHLEGFFQKSGLAGDQLGGGVPGSRGSSSRPISEWLPLIVSILVRGLCE